MEHREHVTRGQVRLGQAVGGHSQHIVGGRLVAGRHRVARLVELHVGQKARGVAVVEGELAICVGLHGEGAGVTGDHGGRGAGGLVGHGLGDLVAEGRVLDPGAHDRVRVVAHQLDLVVLLAGERLGGTQDLILVVPLLGSLEGHLLVGAGRIALALGHLGHSARALEVEPLGELDVLALNGVVAVGGRSAHLVHAVEVGVEPHGAGDLGGAEVTEAAGELVLVAAGGHVEGHGDAVAHLVDLVVVVLGVGGGVAGQDDHAVQRGVRGVVVDERLHIVVEHLRRLAGEVLPAERVVGVGVGVDGGIGARGVALDVVHRAASILQQLGTDDLSRGLLLRGAQIAVLFLDLGDREVEGLGIVGGAADGFHGVAGQVLGALHGHVHRQVAEVVVAVVVAVVGAGVLGAHGERGALARDGRGHGRCRRSHRREHRRAVAGKHRRRRVRVVVEVLDEHPRAALAGLGHAVDHGLSAGHEVPLLQNDLLADEAALGVLLAAHGEVGVVAVVVVDAVVVGVVPQVAGDEVLRDVHDAAVVVGAIGALGQIVGERGRHGVGLLVGMAAAGGGHHLGVALHRHAAVAVNLVLVRVHGIGSREQVGRLRGHGHLRGGLVGGHVGHVDLVAGHVVVGVGDLEEHGVLVGAHEVAVVVVQVGIDGVVVALVDVGGQDVAAAQILVGDAHLVAVDDDLKARALGARLHDLAVLHPATVGALQVLELVGAVHTGDGRRVHVGVGHGRVGPRTRGGVLRPRLGHGRLHGRGLGLDIVGVVGRVLVGPLGIPRPGIGAGHAVVALQRHLDVVHAGLGQNGAGLVAVVALHAVVVHVLPDAPADGLVRRPHLAHVAAVVHRSAVGKLEHPVVLGDVVAGPHVVVVLDILGGVLVALAVLHPGGQDDLAVVLALDGLVIVVGIQLVVLLGHDVAAGDTGRRQVGHVRIELRGSQIALADLLGGAVAGEQPGVLLGTGHGIQRVGHVHGRDLHAVGREVELVVGLVLHHADRGQLVEEVHALLNGLAAHGGGAVVGVHRHDAVAVVPGVGHIRIMGAGLVGEGGVALLAEERVADPHAAVDGLGDLVGIQHAVAVGVGADAVRQAEGGRNQVGVVRHEGLPLARGHVHPLGQAQLLALDAVLALVLQAIVVRIVPDLAGDVGLQKLHEARVATKDGVVEVHDGLRLRLAGTRLGMGRVAGHLVGGDARHVVALAVVEHLGGHMGRTGVSSGIAGHLVLAADRRVGHAVLAVGDLGGHDDVAVVAGRHGGAVGLGDAHRRVHHVGVVGLAGHFLEQLHEVALAHAQGVGVVQAAQVVGQVVSVVLLGLAREGERVVGLGLVQGDAVGGHVDVVVADLGGERGQRVGVAIDDVHGHAGALRGLGLLGLFGRLAAFVFAVLVVVVATLGHGGSRAKRDLAHGQVHMGATREVGLHVGEVGSLQRTQGVQVHVARELLEQVHAVGVGHRALEPAGGVHADAGVQIGGLGGGVALGAGHGNLGQVGHVGAVAEALRLEPGAVVARGIVVFEAGSLQSRGRIARLGDLGAVGKLHFLSEVNLVGQRVSVGHEEPLGHLEGLPCHGLVAGQAVVDVLIAVEAVDVLVLEHHAGDLAGLVGAEAAVEVLLVAAEVPVEGDLSVGLAVGRGGGHDGLNRAVGLGHAGQHDLAVHGVLGVDDLVVVVLGAVVVGILGRLVVPG